MGFTWFKKGTFEKLANLVRSIGYPIALQNKLDESLGKDYLPQEIPPEQKPNPLVSFGTEFKPTEVAPTTETPAPQGDENKTLSEDIANLKPQTLQETPVPTTTGTPTKDLSGIQTILQSQESAKSWNKKVQRDYLDFLKYATKFGEQGKQYMDMANYLAQGSMKEIPKLTNIDPKQVMKDKNGDAYMLYLNPMGGTVKQPLGVKFDEIVQPKFNKDMLHFEMGDDGNAVIRNLENGTTVNTGIPFGQFDTKWDIQNKLYNLKEAHDLGMLDIAQQKLLKSGKGGNSEGDGSPTGSNDLMVLDPNGNPLATERREDDKGNEVIYIAGTNIPASVINDEIKGIYGSKKEFKKNAGSLNFQGFTVTSKKKYQTDRRSFYPDYQRKLLSGEITPQQFGDIVNFDYKQGVISKAEYDYIKKNLTGQ